MKKLFIIALALTLVALSDALYIFYSTKNNESSTTKTSTPLENVTKEVDESKLVTKEKDDCVSLYSYEVPSVDTSYVTKKEDNVTISEVDDDLSSDESKNVIVTDDNAFLCTQEDDQEQTKEEVLDEEVKQDDALTEVVNNEVEESKQTNMGLEVAEDVNNPVPSTIKNGFYEEGGNTYYYENDVLVTGLKNIDGVNHYFSPSGKYLGTTKVKVVDVSYYQGDINWDLFASQSDCYGVILRLGYYDVLDKKFERNISEVKRLNIPYGIYLFSYSTTLTGAKKEAFFTNNMIDKYELNPTLGIYYDIESWSSSNGSSSNEVSKEMYDNIVSTYVNEVLSHVSGLYKVKVYSGRWYAMNRLGSVAKSYVDWVAEYNDTLKYDDTYSMWQYTSKGSVPGISGNVDISYLY